MGQSLITISFTYSFLFPRRLAQYRFASSFLKCGNALVGLAGKASVSFFGSGSRCGGFCMERECRYEDSRGTLALRVVLGRTVVDGIISALLKTSSSSL